MILKSIFNFFLQFLCLIPLGLAAEKIDRTNLPIHPPEHAPIKIEDVRNVKAPAFFQVSPPKQAPNVLIILIDDFGYGQAGTFGGPVQMPNLERLSKQGIRYNNFHTTALCSPTRMALQTGRNHHSANAGSIMEFATSYPGNTSLRPGNIAPLAEILKLNGYNTAAFGKYHETPTFELGPTGPFTQWPTGSGFEKFYGFIGGETNQWAPTVYDNTTRVDLPNDPTYHFTTDMTEKAMEWVKTQKSLTPDKPFFVYFAPGATHAPHHVPKKWIEKYKGKFDEGWDKLREQTLERQKKLGIVPENTQLAPKPKDIKDWNTLSNDEKRLFSHQMEVFAGFGEHTDYEIGRLLTTIQDLGVMDNTLIFYIVGDNGASAEGGMIGSLNESMYFNLVPEKVEDILKHYDELGGPSTFGHYAAGWAIAGVTPFAWPKQMASDFGGTSNPLIIHWPKGIKSQDELRTQFHHVIDVAPTILEAANIPMPKYVNGFKQVPMEGTSMIYSFDNPKAKERHTTQYFEIFGNRGIYNNGWFARTIHAIPWDVRNQPNLKDDKWELFNTQTDFSLANDLSSKYPKKLEEMKKLFMKEGLKYKVLPIDDRRIERMQPKLVGRPTLLENRNKITLYEGMLAMAEDVFINLKNKSSTITANIVSEGQNSGVIVCQGGRFGGWSFYLNKGKPVYTYNFVGEKLFTIKANKSVPKGTSSIRFDFKYDGGGIGKGGIGTIFIDGEKVGEGRIEHTIPNLFSVSDFADVGMDLGTSVANDYISNKFTGKIEKITIEY